ncbi:MAG: GNAT family N-acetyltransferase [Pseudomonadota bacterium]
MTNWVEATYCCAGEPPAFLEAELERLYGTRLSCLPCFKLHGSWDGVRAYVAHHAGAAQAVFLYRCEGGRAVVLNEGMKVSEEVVNRFANYLFRNHDGLSLVAFHFVEAGARRYAYPFQCAACGQDTVLELPESADAYDASLAAGTRRSLNHRLSRIRRELPGFAFAVYEKQQVPVRQVRTIIRLHRLNMAARGEAAWIDAAEEERIIAYVGLCGFVSIASSKGAVCAGAITYRLGSNFTARILAHDPAHAGLRLGFVCAYLTIRASIATGNSRYFHFGWGQRDYKRQLGGRERRLVRLTLFRSRAHMLRNAGAALAALLGGGAFHVRRWLLQASRHDGWVVARLADLLIAGGRRLRALRSAQAVRRELP